MKKILSIIAVILLQWMPASAAGHVKDEAKSSMADNIVGKYFINNDGETSNVRCYKTKSGKYNFQMYDMPLTYDKNGDVILDVHNPNKELRSRPANQIIIIWGLSYNAGKKQWDGGTIYDPRNGITADATVDFVDGGKIIRVRGSVLGIGKSVYWDVVE